MAWRQASARQLGRMLWLPFIAALVVSMAKNYTHVLAPATGFGKNFMPVLVCWRVTVTVEPGARAAPCGRP